VSSRPEVKLEDIFVPKGAIYIDAEARGRSTASSRLLLLRYAANMFNFLWACLKQNSASDNHSTFYLKPIAHVYLHATLGATAYTYPYLYP
jgi:hypothetical protein